MIISSCWRSNSCSSSRSSASGKSYSLIVFIKKFLYSFLYSLHISFFASIYYWESPIQTKCRSSFSEKHYYLIFGVSWSKIALNTVYFHFLGDELKKIYSSEGRVDITLILFFSNIVFEVIGKNFYDEYFTHPSFEFVTINTSPFSRQLFRIKFTLSSIFYLKLSLITSDFLIGGFAFLKWVEKNKVSPSQR